MREHGPAGPLPLNEGSFHGAWHPFGSSVVWLATERVGPLTGSRREGHPELREDPQYLPLLNELWVCGVQGADLGANTEHSDGRLYFFTGDVTPVPGTGNPDNADMVAWTDETRIVRHGGHFSLGQQFVLPFGEAPGPSQQPDWRHCLKCGSMFWDGDPRVKGVCAAGGVHAWDGPNFTLPFGDGAGPGQPKWSFCGQCSGMFYNGYDSGEHPKGVCPAGGSHSAMGWNFVLPNEPPDSFNLPGERNWRYCVNCAALFWDGGTNKGICAGARGGGLHVHPVLNHSGKFDAFRADPPVGLTLTVETPGSAFSFNGRVYVFCNISEEKYSGQVRPGDPAYGTYLVSKSNPDQPGPYQEEFMFSPRLGWRYRDDSRTLLEGHEVLGYRFVIPLGPTKTSHWRSCANCRAMFWDGDPGKGHCPKGVAGSPGHQADERDSRWFSLPDHLAEDAQNQGSWTRCIKCLALFWAGDPGNRTGLCPAGGDHQPDRRNFVLPHASITRDIHHLDDWRFCAKCFGLFWAGELTGQRGTCPVDGQKHQEMGFNFVLPHHLPEDANHQSNWSFCEKCFGMFWIYAENNHCPANVGGHVPAPPPDPQKNPIPYYFALPHSLPPDSQNQDSWYFCDKCGGLFWNGDKGKGTCPADPRGHHAAGLNFVLPHNPGVDANNQGDWRFCVKCNELVWTGFDGSFGSPHRFASTAPVVVDNADHPGLPAQDGRGLVVLGFSYYRQHWEPGGGFYLAWMPLGEGGPRLQDVQYYAGHKPAPLPAYDVVREENIGGPDWKSDPNLAALFLGRPATYTAVSAAWLKDPGLWILLDSNADDGNPRDRLAFEKPVFARIAPTLWRLPEAKPIPIFDPRRENAYTHYMHLEEPNGDPNDRDDIATSVSPPWPGKGWAYGAFLMNRFSEWNPDTQELDIYYLLSLHSPYQIQVMHTRLRVR